MARTLHYFNVLSFEPWRRQVVHTCRLNRLGTATASQFNFDEYTNSSFAIGIHNFHIGSLNKVVLIIITIHASRPMCNDMSGVPC